MFKKLASMMSFLRCDRGTAAIEFAIIAPVMMLLTVAVIDFGRYVWLDTTLDHAAKEAARYASVRGAQSALPVTDDQLTTYVRSRAIGVPGGDLGVAINWAPNNNAGSAVTIDLTYEYSFLLKGFLPVDTHQLAGSATMTVL